LTGIALDNTDSEPGLPALSDPYCAFLSNLGGKDTGMIKPYTIVGVLADQVDSNVGGSIQLLVLLPQQQIPTTSLFYQALLKTIVTFVVKTRGSIPVDQQMRTVFHQLAPGFALDNFQTMQEAVDKNTFSQRLGLYLVGSFAGPAIAMVIAGLYGVLSQLVSNTCDAKSECAWRLGQRESASRILCCGRDRS
jgi:hypothetical protein